MFYDIEFTYITIDGKKITYPLEVEAKNALEAEEILLTKWNSWGRKGEVLTAYKIKRNNEPREMKKCRNCAYYDKERDLCEFTADMYYVEFPPCEREEQSNE